MAEFFLLKFRALSKVTDEIYIGYFLGRSSGELEMDFVVLPRKYMDIKDVDIVKVSYTKFKEKLRKIKEEFINSNEDLKDLNHDFKNFIGAQLNKDGRMKWTLKLHRCIEEKDEEVLRLILREMLEGWSSRVELDIAYELLDFEDVTSEVASESEESELMKKIYERADLKGLPEIYPIVDPIAGAPIDMFEIGDRIFFVVMNLGSEEYKKKLLEDFPDHFSEDGENTKPFVGELVSKEIIPTISRNFVLIKVDFGNGVIGKAVIFKNVKLMIDEERLKSKLSENEEKKWVEYILKEFEKDETRGERRSGVRSVSLEERKTKFGLPLEFVYGLILSLIVLGIVLLILYFFFS